MPLVRLLTVMGELVPVSDPAVPLLVDVHDAV